MTERSLFALLHEVFLHASARRRGRFYASLALMLVGALAELAAIGAVIPFLALAGGTPKVGAAGTLVAAATSLAAALGMSTMQLATAMLILLAIGSMTLRLLLTWTSQKLAYDIGHDLSTKIYARLLHQPYTYHLMHNSSDLIVGIGQVPFVISGCLLPAMQSFISLVVALFIVMGLLTIDPAVAMLAALGIAAVYTGIALSTKSHLRANSKAIVAAQKAHMLVLREGIGGIRDVLLGRSQAVFAKAFAGYDARICDKRAVNQFIALAPRFFIEASGMIMIAIVGLYASSRPGGLIGALPMLGALAVGAQRLLPLIQQIYVGYSSAVANTATLANVLRFLEISAAASPNGRAQASLPPFHQNLTFRDVSFRYPTANRDALRDISLDIPKGQRVGLIGSTGSGKSTLVDVLMALVPPSSGEVRVDGLPLDAETMLAWQAQIAHVPQAIYLSDSSVAANIAFGVASAAIDMARVRDAARRASLDTFVMSLPLEYETVVGESGIRLSGGQRQRIGIARALYRGGGILVLDEATSALDDATEAEVMQAIGALAGSLTVIMVAHRLSTLAICDRIIRLEEGRIVESGSYDQIVGCRASAN